MTARVGYSAEQVRSAEAPLLAAGEPLMALAAAGLADRLRRLLAERPGPVLLLVGSGDNGGDALFAGAELAAEGVEVAVVPTGRRMHEAGAAAAREAGATEERPADAAALARDAAIVVDGILGTGTSPEPALRGLAREVVVAVRAVLAGDPHPLVVAVDVPSGIDPTDGRVPDAAAVLPADVTVTFGAIKAGLLLPPARDLAGDVRLIDIGLGHALAGVEPVVVEAER